jgi:hypothetical protein
VNGTAPIHFPLPKPPAAGSGSMVMATKGPITSSRMENEGFTFEKNSAGLGVPRGQLGNLNGISRDVVHNGAMTMPVDVHSAMRGAHANGEVRGGGPVMMKPAGAPEVREAIHSGAGPGGNRGNEAGNRVSGANNSGAAQHNSGGNNSGGAPQHTYSGGGGGNNGGGGGGHPGGGGGAPPPSPPPAASGNAAPSGGSHK